MDISAISSASAATASITAKLSLEEQQYDIDGDGSLSTIEKAALQAAQLESQQAASAIHEKKPNIDTVELSKEAQNLLRASQELDDEDE